MEREERGGEGKKGREKEGRGRKTCCPMSNKLSPPMLGWFVGPTFFTLRWVGLGWVEEIGPMDNSALK